MKRIVKQIFISLFLPLAFDHTASIAQAGKNIGMILNIEGEVFLIRIAEKKADICDYIKDGDHLVTKRGSSATLVFFEGCYQIRIFENSAVSLTQDGITILNGKISDPKAVDCIKPLAVTTEDVQHQGALILRGGPWKTDPRKEQAIPLQGRLSLKKVDIVRPGYSSILRIDSVFQWHPLHGATDYRVSLFRFPWKRLWTYQTESKRLKYPATQPPLERGLKYQWEVAALSGKRIIGEGGSEFLVLTGEEERKVKYLEKNRDLRICPRH